MDTANLTLQFSSAITQTPTDTGTNTNTLEHKDLLKLKCTFFPSSAHTHTHTHWEALQSARLDVQPRRAHEIWLSCVRLTGILDKANPNLYAAWQAGTLSNANARDTLEVVALCGYFYKHYYTTAPWLVAHAVLERASWWRCLHSLHQSHPFRFLSLSALSSCYSLKRLGIISPQETGNM